VAAGASVAVPLATFTVTPLVPTVAAGAAVAVPLATFTVTPLVPTIQVGGITIDVPVATFTVTPLVPTVAAGAAVAVPLATFTVSPQVPAVATAAIVEVPLATFTVTPQVPTVSTGIVITPFPSMAIETDADRTSIMSHDNVTVLHGSTVYLGVMAETDGETLDGGTDFDGVMELQLRTSDITAGNILEGDSLTIDSVVYTIGKIDNIGGGMSVLYLVT